MREHQIVFSLKPEQYQELQRQAKAAGARSVGMFVRQKVLASLGMDKEGQVLKRSGEKDPDWRFISYEVRRLHRELKMLLSESTNDGSMPQYNPDSHLEEARALMAATIDGAPTTREEFLAGTVPVLKENFLTDGAPLAPAPAESPEASFEMAVNYTASRNNSDFSTPAEIPVSTPAAKAPPPEPIKPILEQRDDLEVLADRAFAISPRLGSIEPSAPSPTFSSRNFSDTLNDLLDQGLISQTVTRDELAQEVAAEVEAPPRIDEALEVEDIDQVLNEPHPEMEETSMPRHTRVDQLFEPHPDAASQQAQDRDQNTNASDSSYIPPPQPTHAPEDGDNPPPVPPPKRRRS